LDRRPDPPAVRLLAPASMYLQDNETTKEPSDPAGILGVCSE
jgi:hypothetical protein